MIYSAVALIRSLVLADLLKRDGKLVDAVCFSLMLVLPEHTAKPLCDKLQSGTLKVPSHSTISRFRLSLDVGMMCVEREENGILFNAESPLDLASMPAVYILADSSEQGGYGSV